MKEQEQTTEIQIKNDRMKTGVISVNCTVNILYANNRKILAIDLMDSPSFWLDYISQVSSWQLEEKFMTFVMLCSDAVHYVLAAASGIL